MGYTRHPRLQEFHVMDAGADLNQTPSPPSLLHCQFWEMDHSIADLDHVKSPFTTYRIREKVYRLVGRYVKDTMDTRKGAFVFHCFSIQSASLQEALQAKEVTAGASRLTSSL